MRSMTGYGRGSAVRDGNRLTVELSSVNSRKQADIRLAASRELSSLEPVIKQCISRRLRRGAVTVTMQAELSPALRQSLVRVDGELAAHLAAELRQIGERLGVDGRVRLGELLAVPGVVVVDEALPAEGLAALAEEAVNGALDELIAMRDAEGVELRNDLCGRHRLLTDLLDRIADHADDALARHRDRLQARIVRLGVDLELDDERLAKEVAFCAERSDISEEIVRLRSHLSQLLEKLDADDDAGRSLEFLCQEMTREISTICAKARETEIAALGLEFKAEISRVREQVMNVE